MAHDLPLSGGFLTPPRRFLNYCQRLMGPSPLSAAQRELIGAFVSALNSCKYWQVARSALAVTFGVDEGLVAALIANVDAAPVEGARKPVRGLYAR